MIEKDLEPKPPNGTVSAFPTKKFFMSMLTRDIALDDAIMDLLDNCIDGVHRQIHKNGIKSQKPFAGFYCELELSSDKFTIKDNCGGISLDNAIQYAFKMGRSDDYKDDVDIETVGMYGIGMKRAIFKIGDQAKVLSNHSESKFTVDIPADWMSDLEWNFKYTLHSKEVEKVLPNEGTMIEITQLKSAIAEQLSKGSEFIQKFSKDLKSHYGYIIDQGFSIKVNGNLIDPLEFNLLTASGEGKGIRPYAYTTILDDVEVEVIIGFYRPPATQKEMDEQFEAAVAKSSTENAGITVICNDRVVLYCDKTFLTGWGDPPIPKYHTQFINIAGVVHFRSKDPIKLPVTTTKRGLDTSSRIYAETRIRIREGLRIFTSFTNNWKSPSEERSKLFENTQKFNALAPGQTKSANIKVENRKSDPIGGLYQIPELPRPDDDKREKLTTISFQKEKEKIKILNEYYFDGDGGSASKIGEWCFDRLFSQID